MARWRVRRISDPTRTEVIEFEDGGEFPAGVYLSHFVVRGMKLTNRFKPKDDVKDLVGARLDADADFLYGYDIDFSLEAEMVN